MEEPGAPRDPRRRYYWLAAALVVLVALGFAARPAYRGFKTWRALQLAASSEQALREGNLDEAARQANLAVLQAPGDVRITRQVARVYTVADPRQALVWWQQTVGLANTPENRRDFIQCALAAGDLPLAARQLRELQTLAPNDPQTWLAEARVRIANKEPAEAYALLKRVLATRDAPVDSHLLYAHLSLLSPDPLVQAAGLEHLRLLAARSDALGLAALRMLVAGVPGQNPYQLEESAKKLESHPQATLDDRLQVLTVRARVPGANEAALVAEARALFSPGDTAGLVRVGQWLNQRKRYTEVLNMIDSETAFSRRDLLLVRLDAMAQLGQWQAILDTLNKPKVPLPTELRLLFEARALTELGRGPMADLAWEKARRQIAGDPAKLYDFAVYAARLGFYDVARPIFTQLASESRFRRDAYQQLVNLDRRQRRTVQLRRLFLEMEKFYPDDPVVRNDILYIGFLLGEAGPEQLEKAHALVRAYPDMLSYRITLALGCLAAGQPRSALEAFNGLNLPALDTIEPAWRAVIVATLRANGLEDGPNGARELDKLVPRQVLLPEERALLERTAPQTAQ